MSELNFYLQKLMYYSNWIYFNWYCRV